MAICVFIYNNIPIDPAYKIVVFPEGESRYPLTIGVEDAVLVQNPNGIGLVPYPYRPINIDFNMINRTGGVTSSLYASPGCPTFPNCSSCLAYSHMEQGNLPDEMCAWCPAAKVCVDPLGVDAVAYGTQCAYPSDLNTTCAGLNPDGSWEIDEATPILTPGGVAGVSIAVIVVCVLLVVGIFFLVKRRSKQPAQTTAYQAGYHDNTELPPPVSTPNEREREPSTTTTDSTPTPSTTIR